MNPKDLAETEGKPLALSWVVASRRAIVKPTEPLVEAALRTNFAWHEVKDEAKHLAHIASHLEKIEKVLHFSARYFVSVSLERARELFGAKVPPTYSMFEDRIFFTPVFADFGPKCRAAMIVHETVHIFDRRSGEPEIHISEWDERFETRTAIQQLHNASAYASFTAQIHEKRLEWPREDRFGAGNRNL